jgi:hypothetical protein
MAEERTVFSGNDEGYIGTGGRALQLLVSVNTPDPRVKRETRCNTHVRKDQLVREIGEYWWGEKGLGEGESMRLGLMVRDGGPSYTGGRGANFRLAFPSMFEHYAHQSGLNIRRVVASFDGILYRENEEQIKGIRVNGWEVRTLSYLKGDPANQDLPIPLPEDMRAMELVKEADALAHFLSREVIGDDIGKILDDKRLAYVWVGSQKLDVRDIVGKRRKRSMPSKKFFEMAIRATA